MVALNALAQYVSQLETRNTALLLQTNGDWTYKIRYVILLQTTRCLSILRYVFIQNKIQGVGPADTAEGGGHCDDAKWRWSQDVIMGRLALYADAIDNVVVYLIFLIQ